MVATIAQWTIDAQDVPLMAEFWSAALGYRSRRLSGGEVKLLPPEGAPETALSVLLQPSAGPKTGKNRAHPDLIVSEGGVDAEVDRLIGLGAKRADVGQSGDEPFVVLADPQGNEFCLIRGDPRSL
jgi:hypothetical protein